MSQQYFLRLFLFEQKMIEMEEELKSSVLHIMGLNADDKELFKKLQLKVEYVDDMNNDNEAELLPTDDGIHLGIIRLRKELKKYKFAYIHEIIHYIFDIGYGNKVTKAYARKRQGKTDSYDEQRINYKTAVVRRIREVRSLKKNGYC